MGVNEAPGFFRSGAVPPNVLTDSRPAYTVAASSQEQGDRIMEAIKCVAIRPEEIHNCLLGEFSRFAIALHDSSVGCYAIELLRCMCCYKLLQNFELTLSG